MVTLSSFQNGAFFYPTGDHTRDASDFFNSFSVYYGMDKGLEIFTTRIQLAKTLVKLSRDRIFILILKLITMCALRDEQFTNSVSKYSLAILKTLEVHLAKMVVNAGLVDIDKHLSLHIREDFDRVKSQDPLDGTVLDKKVAAQK